MNIITTLATFALFSILVTIATSNIRDIFKPVVDLKVYKLVIAFVITIIGIIGLNVGIMESLELITDKAYPWIHYFDLGLTAVFLTKGSQAIHRLNKAFINYLKEGGKNE